MGQQSLDSGYENRWAPKFTRRGAANGDAPERARPAEILCHQPDDLTEGEIFKRRIEAIDLQVALCDKREPVKDQSRPAHQIRVTPGIELAQNSSPHHFPFLMEPDQCPDCIGDGD